MKKILLINMLMLSGLGYASKPSGKKSKPKGGLNASQPLQKPRVLSPTSQRAVELLVWWQQQPIMDFHSLIRGDNPKKSAAQQNQQLRNGLNNGTPKNRSGSVGTSYKRI